MRRIIDQWLYFGCGNGAGHYLFSECRRTPDLDYGIRRRLEGMDGKLAPQPEIALYRAAVSRLGGMGISALSWWDRTVDTRGGSNSIIFAPGLDLDPQPMLDEAAVRFPWVFARLPEPIQLLGAP